MTDIEKLITTARHYCMDNFSYWSDKYSNESSGNNNPYSDNDYNLFPRYNVLMAIRQGVETLVGQSFASFEACKEKLKDVGQKSHSIYTINSNKEIHLLGESGRFLSTTERKKPIEKNAMTEERNKFIEFIQTRTVKNVSTVEPLPYVHRLTDQELLIVRQNLSDKWNFDGGYWDPLNARSPHETVFLMKDNITLEDWDKIIEYLIFISSKRIYEITEERIDYEIEFDSFDFELNEAILTDQTFEWVIYGSHEETIAFGGTWLIEFIKQLFADRQDKLNKWE